MIGHRGTVGYAPASLPPPLVSSFVLQAAAGRALRFARGLLFRRIPGAWRRLAEALGGVSIPADQAHLDPASVAEIREKGYSALAYTVNEPARARLLLRWGVTSVLSDVPHIILAAVGDRPAATVATAAGRAALPRQGRVP